jgi:hypothetical protein
LNVRSAERPHDADDQATLLRRILPSIAEANRGRRVAFAEYDPDRKVLHRRWSSGPEGGVAEGEISLDPVRIHPLLAEDAAGDRPLRPGDNVPSWAVQTLIPETEADAPRVFIRSLADEGRWLGILLVAEPKRWLPGSDDRALHALADVLELGLARVQTRKKLVEAEEAHRGTIEALARRFSDRVQILKKEVVEARRSLSSSESRLEALDEATGKATELLTSAHEELARRTERLRRQTRVQFLLRQLLERHAQGIAPRELATDLVSLVSEAFAGSRCSLLLVDPLGKDGAQMRVAAALGLPSAVDPRRLRVSTRDGVSGWVARNRQELVVRDPSDAAKLPVLGVDSGGYTNTAFVSFPLVSHGRFQGVLNLTNFKEGFLDEAEIEQLRLVALCVGLVVDHARLNERLFALDAG